VLAPPRTLDEGALDPGASSPDQGDRAANGELRVRFRPPSSGTAGAK
jgi:hypothetical protein